MSEFKIAKSLEVARSWAASFHAEKVETTIQCPHGKAVKIDIMEKGHVVDSMIACCECWQSAPYWVKVD